MTWTLFILSWLVFRANVLADDDKRTITRKDIDVQSSFSRSSRPQEGLPLVYMIEHCQVASHKYKNGNKIVQVNSSIIVEAASAPLKGKIVCVATFEASNPQERLLLHFEKMAINYNTDTIDRLRIFDGYNVDKQLTPPLGLYGIYLKDKYQRSGGNIHDYVSSGPAMTLYFMGEISRELFGFRVLITTFRGTSVGDLCPSSYLRCSRYGRCIPQSLQCNGYDNCGDHDYSDRQSCSHILPPSSHHKDKGFGYSADLGLIVGCAISIVILMVVVLWLGIVCIKRTKRLRTSHRRYHSTQSAHIPVPHSDVDGAIVEPADIHHIVTPAVSFLEPPPPYTAQPSIHPVAGDRELELPPPYSIDERDTAALLVNESPRDQSGPLEREVSHRSSTSRELVPMMLAGPLESLGLVGERSNRDTLSSEVVTDDEQTHKDTDEIEAATEAVVDGDVPVPPIHRGGIMLPHNALPSGEV